MNRFYILICIILYTLPVYSLSSYSATYSLSKKTDLGYVKLGVAKYELILANKVYVFNSNASTNMLWSTIYDFSVNETSIGLIDDGDLISNYYKISEKEGESYSDSYEINIYPEERYVSLNNEIRWGTNSNNLVDILSIYLHISEDIQKDLNKKVFTYQLVDKKGINQREFTIEGVEILSINNNELETIRIVCPELRLIFNVSKEHNFMPVNIEKTNGKTQYRLRLKDFNQKS